MVTNLSPDGPGPRPPSRSSAGTSRSAKAAVLVVTTVAGSRRVNARS